MYYFVLFIDKCSVLSLVINAEDFYVRSEDGQIVKQHIKQCFSIIDTQYSCFYNWFIQINLNYPDKKHAVFDGYGPK